MTFALDCCDREAISWVASANGYSSDDVRDVMREAIEQRFGSELPASPAQWLSDNGSTYAAEQTRASVARQIRLQLLTAPVCNPQSNGMAEILVKTMKRDYIRRMPKPDRTTALRNLAIAFEHYNEEHPHSALNLPLTSGVQALGRRINLTGVPVSGLIGASPRSSQLPSLDHSFL